MILSCEQAQPGGGFGSKAAPTAAPNLDPNNHQAAAAGPRLCLAAAGSVHSLPRAVPEWERRR